MVKKIKLDINPFDDIVVIGINTTMMDYQLASHLNKNLKFDFVKHKDISKGKNLFSYYLYDKGENSNSFNLVALASHEGKDWIPFKPKTDYLLIIRNYIKENELQEILRKIKAIPNIFHAYIVDLETNNKIDIILEDIELHEINIKGTYINSSFK